MNKKPGLLYSVYALAVVILMTVFHLSLPEPENSVVQSVKNVDITNRLFVCPMSNETWDLISGLLESAKTYIYMGGTFIVIVLLFSWGWALYQNLLKDKFSADVYKTPWLITKITFWIIVICFVLLMTPNYFRTKVPVRSKGQLTDWVLCEQNSEHAQSIKIKKIVWR